MNYTTNYRIQKPFNTEKYDVNIYNTNADIIDSALNKLELENASQDALLATKEELSNSNRSIENEIQRATAKENEILDSLNTNKTIWDNKYTREEIDDKFDNIVIPTKISDLENDSNLGSITGIKGNNEAEYRNTGNINITADNIGAAKVIQLYGTSGNVINLDTLTDFGLYKINNNDTIMWVTYNGGNSQIDCRYMELFVGGNDKFKYQIIFPLDYYNKFRMRSITINEDETTEFSEWSEIATLNDLISYIDAQYVKNSQILDTKEQIDANTSTKSIAGALAVKEIKNELTNDINQINSNLNGLTADKIGALPTGRYYNGLTTSINDVLETGISRIYVQHNSDDAKYLGFYGQCLIINSLSTGYLFQIIFCTEHSASIAWRRNDVQNNITLTYQTQLFKIIGEVVNY